MKAFKDWILFFLFIIPIYVSVGNLSDPGAFSIETKMQIKYSFFVLFLNHCRCHSHRLKNNLRQFGVEANFFTLMFMMLGGCISSIHPSIFHVDPTGNKCRLVQWISFAFDLNFEILHSENLSSFLLFSE